MRYIEICGLRSYLTFDEREVYELIVKHEKMLASKMDQFQANIADKMFTKGILSALTNDEGEILYSINHEPESVWRF